MSKPASPTLIGVFVVGAVVLVVVGVLIFGTGKFLAETRSFVMEFDGSIKGLSVGAPVDFRGVRIGSVSEIKAVFDPTDKSFRTPVYAQIELDRITVLNRPKTPLAVKLERIWDSYTGGVPQYDDTEAEELIRAGLRAQLQMQSLVTGQLFVQLDFHPGTPITRRGFDPLTQEFPTVPSKMEQLTAKLENIPLDDLVNGAVRAVTSFDRLMNSPELQNALVNLDRTMGSVAHLTKEADANFGKLRTDVKETLDSAQGAFNQAEVALKMETGATGRLARSLEETFESAQSALNQAEVTLAMEKGEPGRLARSLRATSDTARGALEQSRKTFATVDRALDERSALRYDLTRTLQEISSAARSIRALAEYLERHPEAILVGKGGRGPAG